MLPGVEKPNKGYTWLINFSKVFKKNQSGIRMKRITVHQAEFPMSSYYLLKVSILLSRVIKPRQNVAQTRTDQHQAIHWEGNIYAECKGDASFIESHQLTHIPHSLFRLLGSSINESPTAKKSRVPPTTWSFIFNCFFLCLFAADPFLISMPGRNW